jgi:hypothetical protein
LLCCLLPPHSARAADEGLNAGLAQGRGLLRAGDHAGAFRVYIDLLREYPDDLNVNLELARAAQQAGRITHALLAYERIIAFLPENAGLRLEYAYLLLAVGRTQQAADQLAEARRLDPGIAEGELGKAVAALERHTSTLTGSGRVAGGLLHDSNFSMAPSRSLVQLGNFSILLDPGSREKSSWGQYLHATGEGAWRSSPDSPWWLVGDVTGYQRWYNESNPDRDMTYGRVAAGLRYTNNRTLAELRLKTEMLMEAEEHSVSLYGGEATLVHALTPQFHLIGRAGIDHRNDLELRGRSGSYLFGGVYGRMFFGENGHSVLFGVKGYTADTHEQRFSFKGFEPSVNLSLQLPWRIELLLGLGWHYEQYKGPATVLEFNDRKDTQWQASVFAIKKLTDSLQVEAGWQYRDNHSNSDLYRYDQNLFLLGLAYTF